MTAPHHLSFEEREANFWKQIEEKYGSRKGLENFVFKSYRTKSKVHCDVHGGYELHPHAMLQHNRQRLCRKCAYDALAITLAERNFKERKFEFEQRVMETFGSFEGFEDFVFVSSLTKGTVHCTKHGTYSKCPAHIFKDKNPCAKCTKEQNQEKYLETFKHKMEDNFGESLTFPPLSYKQVAGKALLTVQCHEHGAFKRTPHNLLMSIGCNECQGRKPYAYTAESFKRKVASVRGTEKGLGPTVYAGHDKNVFIECDVHGIVQVYPSTLTSGGWCEQCGILSRVKWDTERVIEESKRLFPQRLKYDNTVYEHYLKPMIFECHTHGKFEAILDQHLRSACGCPGCADRGGYSDMKPGYFYILRSDELTKIGITNKGPDHRVKNINKSGKDFKIVEYFYFGDGSIPRKLEGWALQKYRTTHEQPKEVFDGYTESFYNIDIETLLCELVRKITELDAESSASIAG